MSKAVRRILIITISLLFIIAIFYPKIKPVFIKPDSALTIQMPGGQRELNVDARIIHPIRMIERVNSSGSLLPDEQVDLSFETSGKIVTIHFDEGTAVKRGDLLAKINDRPLQAQLLKLQAQLKLASEREFRQRSLLSSDAISQESYDQAVTELQSIEADILLIEARISETELRAPFDGIIGLRYVSEGAFANSTTRIAQLIKSNILKIEFAVPERYSGEVRTGFPLKFFLDGIPDTLFATVYAVDPRVDERTRNIVVRARYDNPGSIIKPGRFVAIQLELSEIDNALAIPSEALIPEMEGERVFLYKGGKAESVRVTTGMRTEELIQITEGLNPGDTLVTTGILQIRQGMPLTIDNLL